MESAIPSGAIATTPKQVVDILNFALTLEYLEDEFYRNALGSGVITDQFSKVFGTISRHETQRVQTLVAYAERGRGKAAVRLYSTGKMPRHLPELQHVCAGVSDPRGYRRRRLQRSGSEVGGGAAIF